MTFPTTVHRRSRANDSVYTAFLISTLVRHFGVLFLSVLFIFLAVRILLFRPPTDFSVASEHRTVRLQPNSPESAIRPRRRVCDANTATPSCLNNSVGLPPQPRHPLPVKGLTQ